MKTRLMTLHSASKRVKAGKLGSSRSAATPKDQMVELLRQVKLIELAERIEQCEQQTGQMYCVCGELKQVLQRHCRQRLCPVCQSRKAFKISKQVQALIQQLQQETPGIRCLSLTLTLPACDATSLAVQLDKLIKGFQRLLHRRELKPYVIGGLRVVEVGYNHSTETFNPHLHVLLAVTATYFSKGYLSRNRILVLWREATRCSTVNEVAVSSVKRDRHQPSLLAAESANVARYALKSLDSRKWTAASLAVIYHTMHRRKLCSTFGRFKTLKCELSPYQSPCLCPVCGEGQRRKVDVVPERTDLAARYTGKTVEV